MKFFQKEKVEAQLPPVEVEEPVVEAEPEPTPVQVISDPSQIKVPEGFQGIGLEQVIYEAQIAGDLAVREFNKISTVEPILYKCPCGLTFIHKEPYEEHRKYAHNAQSHEVEIMRMNTERWRQ